jgi:hypothetical protein
MDDAKLQERERKLLELGERAQELGKLTEHPSWPVLREEFARKRARTEKALFSQFMSGGAETKAVNQRYLDYWRGFFEGCEWLLSNPEMAETTLETALRKARELEARQQEQEVDQ